VCDLDALDEQHLGDAELVLCDGVGPHRDDLDATVAALARRVAPAGRCR